MKRAERLILVIIIVFAIAVPLVVPYSGTKAIVQAATKIKINHEALNLEVGKTKSLQITGTKNKVIWETEDATVATVTKKGKVTAVSEGETVITATIGKKKLGCLVSVVKPENPYVKNALFQAVEKTLDQISFVIPDDWTYQESVIEGTYYAVIAPEEKISIIKISARPSNVGTKDFKELEDTLSELTSKEDLQKKVMLPEGENSFIKISVYDASFGKVLVLSRDSASLEGKPCFITTYVFTFHDYEMHVTARDGYDSIDILTYAKYLIDSMR